MNKPTTFFEFLSELPSSHPIRKAHSEWLSLFNEVTGGKPILSPTSNKAQMAELMTATTKFRNLLEDHEGFQLPVVRAYCRLLSVDCQLIKAAA